MKKPELLSPVQDYTSLHAAIDNGADAVYFGIKGFNMRANAKNFTSADLPKITRIAHAKNVKTYLALNTIIYEHELKKVESILEKAKKANIDAIICWDMSVIHMAKQFGLEVHLSTQASVSNSNAVEFYKEQGVSRIVLARECTLDDIRKIKKKTTVQLEVFVHGAMCVSVSGRCFMSQFSTCKSANRGECLQPCRRNYIIRDVENEFEYEVGPNYVLSPKDLCTLPFLEKLMLADIDCFKIEGRNKSPEYVTDVTAAYRTMIDFVYTNRLKQKSVLFKKELTETKKTLMKKLQRVYNRGFSNGFFLRYPMSEWTKNDGNVATERKIFLGKIVHYYAKINVVEFKIETKQKLRIGDEIFIQGQSTGTVRLTINSMEINHKKVLQAIQGDYIAIKVDIRARKNDSAYIIKKKNTLPTSYTK
ncbi:MAG: peptidase U32 family protein [bacterium]